MRTSPIPVGPEDVLPLRRAVLRAHQPPDAARFPGDEAPDTLHVAVLGDDGRPVAVASVYREPPPGDDDPGAWRLRGMATTPEARGRGAGAALVEACAAHAAAHGGRRLWCNARIPAAGFYSRSGFTQFGGEFDLPGIGPHVRMFRPLAQGTRPLA